MFRKMPVFLVFLVFVIAGFFPWMSLQFKSQLYGVSLFLKSLILFTLPLLVFCLLFKTAAQLAKEGAMWIVWLVGAICLSNWISTLLSYSVGKFAYGLDLTISMPNEASGLMATGAIELPQWINNVWAMMGGFGLGLVTGRWIPGLANAISFGCDVMIQGGLRFFLAAIPLFIAGFAVKMLHDGTMVVILKEFCLVFAIVSGSLLVYVFLAYWTACGFSGKNAITAIRNMLPAAMVGFGSMSSAAAMPLTILGVEKNSDKSNFGNSIIPATVNVHLVGDCFAIPIFAFAILKSFGSAEPTMAAYLAFSFSFVLAKFSVAAVPGGGILVMLPLLESHLGLNAQMLSLGTALYVLFDPVITTANILGNGAFALHMQKKIKFFKNNLA